ncbi:MAG: hypothetical protein KGK34_01105 [Chloroflexota bacterium]|nr:hypothetical protein [Chloroflexota bacterium]
MLGVPVRTALVAAMLLLPGCGPAARTGGDVPRGWMELRMEEWTMQVPREWEPDAVFRPDSPTTLIRITRPSERERQAMLPPSPPPTFHPLDRTAPPVRMPDPYLTLDVFRFWPKSDLVPPGVSPSPFDPTRARTLRRRFDPDGGREWILEIDTHERTYSAFVRVDAGHAAEVSDTVERVLASARVRGS